MSKRWVKQPQPGEFRGEGEWWPFIGTDDDWRYLRSTGYLPTHEGPDKPKDHDDE